MFAAAAGLALVTLLVTAVPVHVPGPATVGGPFDAAAGPLAPLLDAYIFTAP